MINEKKGNELRYKIDTLDHITLPIYHNTTEFNHRESINNSNTAQSRRRTRVKIYSSSEKSPSGTAKFDSMQVFVAVLGWRISARSMHQAPQADTNGCNLVVWKKPVSSSGSCDK